MATTQYYMFAYSTDNGTTYTVIPTYYADEADFLAQQSSLINDRQLKYVRLDWSKIDIKASEKTGVKHS